MPGWAVLWGWSLVAVCEGKGVPSWGAGTLSLQEVGAWSESLELGPWVGRMLIRQPLWEGPVPALSEQVWPEAPRKPLLPDMAFACVLGIECALARPWQAAHFCTGPAE